MGGPLVNEARAGAWAERGYVPVWGGHGYTVSYAGRGEMYNVHPGLTNVRRLAILTYLSGTDWTAMAPLCRSTGWNGGNVSRALWSLERFRLVEVLPPPAEPVRAPSGKPWRKHENRMLRAGRMGHRWRRTPDGSRHLWQFGWISRRMRFFPSDDPPLREDGEPDPVAGLCQYAQEDLMRPVAMAVMRALWGCAALTILEAMELTGVERAAIFKRLARWEDIGWVASEETRAFSETGRVWRTKYLLTDAGDEAMARHVDALRRAARASGYRATEADRHRMWPDERRTPMVRGRVVFPYRAAREPEALLC